MELWQKINLTNMNTRYHLSSNDETLSEVDVVCQSVYISLENKFVAIIRVKYITIC